MSTIGLAEGRAKELRVPPIVKLIAFLAGLAAVYELWPTFLWATLGIVVLYLVLANGDKVADVLGQVPAGFNGLIRPASDGSGVGRLSGNLKL
jgi:hypothetical protein